MNNWKENALINSDDEIVIRADATIHFICEVIMTIDNAPTVTVDNYAMGYQDGVRKVLSERPKCEWIKDESSSIAYRCSNCEVLQHWSPIKNGKYNFCPNCGADMRGKDK